ncbi:flagellar basal body-associated protein FliL [Edaphobacter sp. 12200R-103]|uniref:flagellar basal body-associated FliL family protein n=1 Tax=Edaphobacter sp. 12200R-103 TaxID=2703788 RepID=UPI00138B7AF9|nr:flagellar basal body-associated FliL family protein [Edaphobacter sp. 12200R-103]QHS51150.1 flagellar basal body-associated FliL family protein [Edaphobacter sp. 12200R-103]
MATTPPIIQAKIASDPVKIPLAPLFIAVVIGVLFATAGVGGVLYYVLRSGKVPIHVSMTPAAAPTTPVKTHMMALEPLLVNLADPSGSAFLRAGLTLEVAETPIEKGRDAKNPEAKPQGRDTDAALRDTALAVLGRQTSDQLLAPGGKDRLKSELKVAFAEHNHQLQVADLFFTEFLVQR